MRWGDKKLVCEITEARMLSISMSISQERQSMNVIFRLDKIIVSSFVSAAWGSLKQGSAQLNF